MIRTLQRTLYAQAKPSQRVSTPGAFFGVKNIRKPCTGELYARFDEGGQANKSTFRLLRHRQTKGAANR
jgi:hypothetical protein